MSMAWKYIAFVLVVLIANLIQAITGFAGTLLAMPVSMKLIGVNQAKTVLNLLTILCCLGISIANFRFVNKKELLKITIFMFAGMLLGIQLFQVFPLHILLVFYAVFIIAVALKKLWVHKTVPLPCAARYGILLAAGIIHGMFVSGGSLLVLYAVFAFKEKNEFRATLSSVWVILNGYLLFFQVRSGFFQPEVIRLSLLCAPPALLGVLIGNCLQKYIRQKTFLFLTYVLLLVSGLILLV